VPAPSTVEAIKVDRSWIGAPTGRILQNPTVGLAVLTVSLLALGSWGYVANVIPWWTVVPMNASAIYLGFTVLHEAMHGIAHPNRHAERTSRSSGRLLRACEIRPRKFYATRHTFISAALTAGLNVKFIAEYTGTSLAMIEQHYGRFLEAEANAQLRMLDAAGGAKTSTSDRGLTVDASKYAMQGMSPTGFGPYYNSQSAWFSPSRKRHETPALRSTTKPPILAST
jgi:hypothetical protein